MASRYPSDLIRCAICLGEQTCPRALPCLHSFCQSCLDNHIQTSTPTHPSHQRWGSSSLESKYSFPCPACRKQTRMPTNGVQGFPKDFRITEFTEAWKSTRVVQQNSTPSCDMCGEKIPAKIAESYCVDCCKYFCIQCCSNHNQKSVLESHIMVPITKDLTVDCSKATFCEYHKTEPIKFHCDTCCHGICVKCLLGDHGNHTVTDITTTLNSKRRDLKDCIQHIHDQIWILQDILFNLTCLEGQIKGKYEETKLQMKKSSRKLVNKIFGAEIKLLCELDESYQRQSDDVYRRKQQCKKHLEQFKSLQARLDGILKVEDINKVLTNYADILNEVNEINITKQYKSKVLCSPEYMEFVPNGNVSLGKLALVPSNVHVQTRTRASSRLVKSTVGQGHPDRQQTSRKLAIRSENLKLASPGNGSQSKSNKTCKSTPQASCTNGATHEGFGISEPQHVTGHYDPLRYHEEEMSANAECVPTIHLLYRINNTGCELGQLNLPFSATFDKEDRLIIAENGNGRLQVFGTFGQAIKIIGLSGCIPRCVATTADGTKFAITDEESKSVKLISEDGTIMKEIYPCGDSFPFGIATVDEDKFAISDIIYECVSIISLSGEKEQRFGSHGSRSASLENPSYLVTNVYGNILVSDSGHHEVKVFDRSGNFLYKFGGYGTGPGQLRYPKGVICDKNGLVYVADFGNDRVVVFSEMGIYCGMLVGRNSGIRRPTGLAYSPRGLVAVIMPDDDQVSVYQLTSPIPRSATQ